MPIFLLCDNQHRKSAAFPPKHKTVRRQRKESKRIAWNAKEGSITPLFPQSPHIRPQSHRISFPVSWNWRLTAGNGRYEYRNGQMRLPVLYGNSEVHDVQKGD